MTPCLELRGSFAQACSKALFLGATLMSCAATVAAPVALSGYYELRPVSGGLINRQHARIYARTSAGTLEYLGSVSDPHWASRWPFRLEDLIAKNIAISTDGRSLIYQHNASLAGGSGRKASGLYRHAVGVGESLLLEADEFTISASRFVIPLPQDALLISRRNASFSVTPLEAVTTDGVFLPPLLLGGNALHRAAYAGDAAAIASESLTSRTLLDSHNHWGLTPLEVAVLARRGKAALQLLALGSEIRTTRDENALIFLASAYRNVEVVDELLRRGVAYEFSDKNGVTPFHALLRFYLGHVVYPPRVTDFDSFVATLEVYLRHGANINLRDGRGRTLLHILADMEAPRDVRAPVAAHLIGRGIDVEARDDKGNTALHYTAEPVRAERDRELWEKWYLPILRAIAERMKSVDVANAAGITPLQRATQLNNMRTAEYLVSLGADPSAPFMHGGLGPKAAGQTIRDRIDAVTRLDWWKASQ